jgi:hypothetical protein
LVGLDSVDFGSDLAAFLGGGELPG